MCCFCTRRDVLIGGGAGLASLFTSPVQGQTKKLIACGWSGDEYKAMNMSSKSGNDAFDQALIAELKRIAAVIPATPGFKFIKAKNAYALPVSLVPGTKGTVLIGTLLVDELAKKKNSGVALAGICAHECAHIHQFFSPYYDRLKTSVLIELHADFVAGYYMGKRSAIVPGEPLVFAQELILYGTYDPSHPRFHGSPGQRAAAMDRGYMLARKKLAFEDALKAGETYVRGL